MKWAFPGVIVVSALVAGGRAAGAFVYDLPRFRIDADRLVIDNRPEWLNESAATEVNRKAFRAQAFSIFDPALTQRIKEDYEKDPWVLGVESVAKRFPNHVRVRLSLREPLAKVLQPTGSFLLDRDGVVVEALPPESEGLYGRLPLLKGVATAPPWRGKKWEDPAVKAAIDILDVLSRTDFLDKLTVLEADVTNYEGRVDRKESEIVLVLPKKVRILWGRPLGIFGEVPLETKLGKIATFLKDAHDIGDVDWNIRFENGGIIPHKKEEGPDLPDED